MKIAIHPLLLTIGLCLPWHANVATEDATPQNASKSFAQIKAMAGQWHGKLPDGKDITITYEEINGGAMLERYRSEDPMWWNMSTAYHLNNDAIIMSHFCSWGNHPRMSALRSSVDTSKIDFDFIDIAYNEPDNGFMRDLVIEFVDENRVIHHWTWREDGVDTELQLTLTRVN